jgi:hypothetical protein
VQFGEKDVVRHNLVQQIIRAYEEYDVAHPQRGGNSGSGVTSGAASSKTAVGTAVEATGKDPNRDIQRA